MNEKPKLTLKLSELEYEVLLQVLTFANTSAIVVKEVELKRNSPPKDVQRMAGLASDAQELIRIITSQAAITPDEKPELLN